ncbi:hypothetical protein FOH10_10255 [Nocardia otitidiscaviarum]|uniref:Transmembrane protein n=1 Tax=Nocardia otitidiscaviarum TaxID=1823 RepID=A0A516NJG8_9NOCA|nr:hypothetical protein [Nocardia otitidiscaviarum]MCP9619509.1 hypothetical protein [Nocardia otitidiscaviarum]QDP79053.1 hypothetical protein FOH10_10255 [Nocardia otitidiscaviarum]
MDSKVWTSWTAIAALSVAVPYSIANAVVDGWLRHPDPGTLQVLTAPLHGLAAVALCPPWWLGVGCVLAARAVPARLLWSAAAPVGALLSAGIAVWFKQIGFSGASAWLVGALIALCCLIFQFSTLRYPYTMPPAGVAERPPSKPAVVQRPANPPLPQRFCDATPFIDRRTHRPTYRPLATRGPYRALS